MSEEVGLAFPGERSCVNRIKCTSKGWWERNGIRRPHE